jgi:hypothetical protein
MSAHDFQVRQAPDRVPTRKLALIALLAIAVGLACVLISWLLGRSSTKAVFTDGVLVVAPAPRGNLDRDLALARRGEALVATQRRRLASYGWVDRSHGIAHIPIDRAIVLTAERGK